MNLSYLNLTTTDAALNLATEQYVFDHLPKDRSYFMLWQNDNAIIIGKYQNTLAEINLPFVQEHGIQVVRRLSGGGTVYHDLGNLNFTFISDAEDGNAINFRTFCLPILRALEAIGVHAEINGRNDLTIGGKKFSGNSQYIRKGRVMHHGTIMFHSNLDILQNALAVDTSKLQSKGIQSVRSRVTNIKDHLHADITLNEFRQSLLEQILLEMPGEAYSLSPAEMTQIEQIAQERYRTWEWNFGSSPACTIQVRRRIEGCGLIEAHLSVDHGIVQSIQFYGDFFSAEEPDRLSSLLIGQRHTQEAYKAVLDALDISQFFKGLTTDAFLQLIFN